MAYQQCRFCPQACNGMIKTLTHEREAHPKLYWEAKAAACRAQAKRLVAEADRYDLKSKEER